MPSLEEIVQKNIKEAKESQIKVKDTSAELISSGYKGKKHSKNTSLDSYMAQEADKLSPAAKAEEAARLKYLAAQKRVGGEKWYESGHSRRKHAENMKKRWKEAQKKNKKAQENYKKLQKFQGYEHRRAGKLQSQISKQMRGGAFTKLGSKGHIQSRLAQLAGRAASGISEGQKASESAAVGAAIAGQQRAVGRRMQSILSGQGVRGSAPSHMMQNIAKQSAKLKAGFDMAQMARSYADKRKAEDASAVMQADIATHDIGQDKAALEFKTGRETFQNQRRANIVNALAAKGKSGVGAVEGIMASEKYMES